MRPPWLLLAAPLLSVLVVLGWFASVLTLWALKDDDPFDVYEEVPDTWPPFEVPDHWPGV